jgi:phage tail-like protein
MIAAEDFQYFVIHTLEGWRQGRSESLGIDQQGRLVLSPQQSIPLPKDVGHAVAIAFDRWGGLYVLDAKHCRLYRYCLGDLEGKPVFRLGDCGSLPVQFNFSAPTGDAVRGGIALGKSTLYIADTFNHRMQAFYLTTFQLRYILDGVTPPYPEAFPARPLQLALPTAILTDQQGDVYVLDTEKKHVVKFNAYGLANRVLPQGDDSPLQEPVDMAIDGQEVLYILDTAQPAVLKFDRAGRALGPVGDFRQACPPIREPLALTVDHQGVMHVADRGQPGHSRVHRFDAQGRYLGSISSSHPCTQLTIAPDGTLYGLCGQEGRIIRFGGSNRFAAQGTYYSRIFDSTKLDCHWHRLYIDAEVPEKTLLDVSWYASNTARESRDILEWSPVLNSPQDMIATRDALFDEARGQYLHLKFELHGDEYHTPAIKLAKVYFERDSYLRYLPAAYQEDLEGRNFLERFLSIVESVSLDIEDKIATIPRYFDARATDAAFLDWLGSWLAIVRDYNWSETQKRQFVENAFQFYAQRGTPAGLQRMIEWFTGGQARVVEHFRVRRPMILGMLDAPRVGQSTMVGAQPMQPLVLEESSRIGAFALKDPTPLSEVPFEQFALDAYDFTVLVNTSGLQDDSQEGALRRLIEDGKPAYMRYRLITTRHAAIQLGPQSLLEVNTVLTQGFQPMRLGKNAVIGTDTFVGTIHYPRGTLGHRSRLSIDTKLQ